MKWQKGFCRSRKSPNQSTLGSSEETVPGGPDLISPALARDQKHVLSTQVRGCGGLKNADGELVLTRGSGL